MGEADFPWLAFSSAADQSRRRGAVMGRAERPAAQQPPLRQPVAQRVDERRLERFLGIERRQNRGQSLRQHRFAGAGRADHQNYITY